MEIKCFLLPLLSCHFFIINMISGINTSDIPEVVFDDSVGYGRTFDGIGGLSGGGATSKLLVNYPEAQQNEILDFLFKPNFGASLHILKVEIGGDAQSTDGTEASHMHYSWDENYQRGYEWWLMKEAKKRNPDIKLSGLPWGFPGWIGQGTNSPWTNVKVTADYIVRWINGAKKFHNLTIDYIGAWNEHSYSIPYMKTLRKTLDERGFASTKLIAADGGWEIADDVLKDAALASDLFGLGAHYPGTTSTDTAKKTGKQLWASEDYSTFNNEVGGGCWARILNQNYVSGLMTATISWNLIASYYKDLPFYRDGLMTATEPWSGHYQVETPIWISAHTTQFSQPGWRYLAHGKGVGMLPKGGSYVALVPPTGNDLTIVIETMTHNHSLCIRPSLPKYTVEHQTIEIVLKGSFAQVPELNVWYSKFGYASIESTMFEHQGVLQVKNGRVELQLGLDEVYTLTTMTTGQKGAYPDSPASKPFPLPYHDDFESYPVFGEPFDLAQQTGAFEILNSQNNKFLRQMALQRPVLWCRADNVNKSLNIIGYQPAEEPFNLAPQTGAYEVISSQNSQFLRQMTLQRPVVWCNTGADNINKSLNLVGNYNWTDLYIEIDYRIPQVNGTSGVFLALRVDRGGCQTHQARGIFFFILKDRYVVSSDLARKNVTTSGPVSNQLLGWHKFALVVQGNRAQGYLNLMKVFDTEVPAQPDEGFAGFGTDNYHLADFDNLLVKKISQGKQSPQPSDSLYFIPENH